MEDLIEMVFEIILDLATEGIGSKKLPKAIRFILFSIIFLIFFVIIVMLLYFSIVSDIDVVTKIILLGVAIILVAFLVKTTKKIVDNDNE